MATVQNDEKILKLKEQIAQKKKQLDKSKRFSPITNCSIELDGVRSNIQILTKDQLIFLLVKLNGYLMSAKALEISDFSIGGYRADEWMSDIQLRIDILNRKDDENKLKDMESKLDRMLSDEKKTELEISEIEDLLK